MAEFRDSVSITKKNITRTTGITPISEGDGETVNTTWYSINGQELTTEPTRHGIYIMNRQYGNGKSVTGKYYK